jgi:hypothetical protein
MTWSGAVRRGTLGMLVLVAPDASAQRVVRESPQDYRAATRLVLTETGRWCRTPDAPGCDLGSISDAIATPDGGVLIADHRGPIRAFTRTGALVRELGRRGEGPGEYRFVHALQLVDRGTLTWYDPALRRVTRVDATSGEAGAVTRVEPPPAVAGMYLVNGSVVALEVPPSERPGDTVEARFRSVPSDGPSRVLARVRRSSTHLPGTPVPVAPPLFAPNAVADVGWAGDIAHSTAERYVVRVFPAGGSPWELRVAIPARPVLAVERDSAIAEELTSHEVRTLAELPAGARERIRRAYTTFPMLESVRVLRDGTVWIRPTAARGASRARWDVFSRTGVRQGYAELPPSATIKDGMRDWVLAVELQEDDVPGVVRYRVGR